MLKGWCLVWLVHGSPAVPKPHQFSQNVQLLALGLADQLSSIVLLAFLQTISQVPLEGLFAPRAGRWMADGRESRSRLVLVAFTQVQSQCTVTAHAVTKDGSTRSVDGQLALDQLLWDLTDYVIVHL